MQSRFTVPWIIGATLLSPVSAGASPKEECIAASDRAQDLRDEGRYRLARDKLLACAKESCPAPIRHDCAEWLEQLDRLMPTVVVSVRDARGGDIAGAAVLVDDAKEPQLADGRPFPIDPGEHVFRAVVSGTTRGEKHVLVRSGEHGRLVDLRAPGRDDERLGTAGRDAATAARTRPLVDAGGTRPITPGVWTFGALTLASAGTFAFFGISGQNDAASLRAEPCAATATCSQAQVNHVRQKLIFADVALGVAAIAAGIDVWLFVARPTVGTVAPRVGVTTAGHDVSASISVPLW